MNEADQLAWISRGLMSVLGQPTVDNEGRDLTRPAMEVANEAVAEVLRLRRELRAAPRPRREEVTREFPLQAACACVYDACLAVWSDEIGLSREMWFDYCGRGFCEDFGIGPRQLWYGAFRGYFPEVREVFEKHVAESGAPVADDLCAFYRECVAAGLPQTVTVTYWKWVY